jgi:hypothetical protein
MLSILVPFTADNEEKLLDLLNVAFKYGECCLEEIFWDSIDESLCEVSATVGMDINYGYDDSLADDDEQPSYICVVIMEDTDNEAVIDAFKELCEDSIYYIPKFEKGSAIGTFKSNAEDAATTVVAVFDDDDTIGAYQKREDLLESLDLKGDITKFEGIDDIKEFVEAVYTSLQSTDGIRFCVFEGC